MIRSYQIVLSASASRLSAPFAGDESQNIPFRQLIFQAVGADAALGSTSGVTLATGVKVALAAPMPLTIGPFSTGPVKLSDFYAIGTGSTLNILGVPF